MKRLVCISLAVLMVLTAMTACAKADAAEVSTAETQAETAAAETQTETAAAETQAPAAETEAGAEQAAGLANPMVEISDPAEFEKQLGISIDPSQIMSDKKLFIINKKLAHIAWTQKNVENEDVEFTLRATKDPEIGPSLHGIQGNPKKINDIKVDGKEGPVTIDVSELSEYTIYSWKVGDTFYSLTYNRSMSQMAMAEVLDQVMFATGTVAMTKSVYPLPDSVDTTALQDGIYTVNMADGGIRNENGKYMMTCDIYTREYFDTVELHNLQPGDTITIGGDMTVTVNRFEEKDGAILINGGDEGDGGCTLIPAGGGTYQYMGPNDISSYRLHGTAALEISENAVLTDTSDIDNGCKEVTVQGPEKIADYLASHPYARLTVHSGSIRTENQKIVEIKTWYTP